MKFYAQEANTILVEIVIGLWITSKKFVIKILSYCIYSHLSSFQMIDIVETVYRGASKGRGLVVSPKGEHLCIIIIRIFFSNNLCLDYSTRYRY